MKTTLAFLFLTLTLGITGHAQLPPPDCTNCIQLNCWYFTNADWVSCTGTSPVNFTNIVNLKGTNGGILLLDTTNTAPAFLFYNVVDTIADPLPSPFTNITASAGTISVWFSPDWSSSNQGGTGPGNYANLISLGMAGTNGPWWAWYLSPDGGTVYFASQTNGGTVSNYLSAPVSLLASNWYYLALDYGPTNSAFYTNGVLVTNGTGVAYWPGTDVTFFAIGSDTNGYYQARGLFSDINTYNYQLAPSVIEDYFGFLAIFYGLASPNTNTNSAVFVGAPFTSLVSPTFDAVTGPGFLVTNGLSPTYPTSANVWITNYSATAVSSNVVHLNFAVGGGANGAPYDVFATAAFVDPVTNSTWSWMGQVYRGTNYILPITNSPLGNAFVILGTTNDTDHDGLTDAYELFVSHTGTNNPDTSGDGMLDGWKVMWGLNPLTNNLTQSTERLNYSYDGASRLDQVGGVNAETIGIDGEEKRAFGALNEKDIPMKKALIFLFLISGLSICLAQTPTGPGIYLNSDSGISLSVIEPVLGGSPGPTLPGNSYAIAETNTPDVAALAYGLQNNPKQIFDFVHDHIRYVHYFGSKKGAELTLLERSGNDLDQCALLVALLNAAGMTNVTYKFGTMSVPYQVNDGSDADYKHWVGTTLSNTDWSAVSALVELVNGERGFPYSGTISGDTNHFVMHHCLVNLVLGGTNYTLDPSFKISEPISGINLSNAMALDTNALMTAAAGTSTADYVQNLNETALSNTLTGFTANLLSYIQSNCPNATVEQVVSGSQIVSSVGYSLGTAPSPFSAYTFNGTLPISTWQYIPTNLMAVFTISLQTSNQVLFVPDLRGDRLSMTFDSNGVAQLWREDTTLFTIQTTGGSSTCYVNWGIDEPFGSWDFTNNTLINGTYYDFDDTTAAYLCTNSTYALFYAFDMNEHYLQKRQDELNSYWAQGLPATSRQIQTETLNVMGLNYSLQFELASEMIAFQTGVLPGWHYNYGRMALETNDGYYIDVRASASGGIAGTGTGNADLNNQWQALDATSFFGSAMESGVIEQLVSSNITAISTVRMLEISSTNTTQKVYLATSNNWTTGANVRSNLVNYSANDLAGFDSDIAYGYKILLPQNGQLPINSAASWEGTGYALVWDLNNSMHGAEMDVSGNYLGGISPFYGTGLDPGYVRQLALETAFRFSTITAEQAAEISNFLQGGDPVNMIDGSYTINTTDLSLGQQEPRGLRLSHNYTPANRYQNPAGMANGWLHNYYFSAAAISDPKISIGATTPAQAAAMLVATCSFLQLHSQQANPQNWSVASLISLWGVNQLLNTCASVTMGNYTLEFVKQPNGSFTPPANCTMTLLQTNSAFNLQERHGRTFMFGTNGLLNKIMDQYTNVSMVFTNNSSNWISTATDWKGRQLTFNYSGSPSRLTSITDGSRTVYYGYSTNYNSQGDLTSYIDPTGVTNTYIYDTNHQILATFNALGQLVTSNLYDAYGRVITQYSQGDTNKTWQFFWSGYLNTEQDPAGGQQQFSYDDKFRVTAFRDAMGNLSQTFYDGQDHTVMTISPLNETNQYIYDGQNNLIASIDPLTYSNTYVYDSQNNLIETVDPNTHSNSFVYNSKFQLTLFTNGAGDSVTNVYSTTDGSLSTRTDSAGTNSYNYEPTYGQLCAVIFPGSSGTNGYLRNSYGDVLSFTNGRAFITTYQYNSRRELTNITAPTNLTTKIVRDAVGNVITNIDPRGYATSKMWSSTQKLLSTTLPTTPAGTPVITNTYDLRDWLAITQDPLHNPTQYSNDLAGRSIAIIDPLSRANSFGYDNDGRRITLKNGAQQTTSQQWNARGNLFQVTDPANNIIQYAYDPAGNQMTLTNRDTNAWQFQFDGANRLFQTTTPFTRIYKQIWNHQGLIATNIQPGSTTTFLYDARNQMTSRTDGVGTTTYYRDPNENVTGVAENGMSVTNLYDAYDRLTAYTNAENYVIQYHYDFNGNVTNIIYPGNRSVTNYYDSLNRLTNVTDWAGRKTTFTYDLASHLTGITRPNGTIRTINYDSAGETTNIIEQAASGAPIAFVTRAFDNAGRVHWEFNGPLPQPYTPPSRTMGYDVDNRLASLGGTNVTSDLNGNMTYAPLTNGVFVNYGFDARNRLESVGGLTYAYDPAGDRVAITNGGNVAQFVINPNAKLPQVLMRIRPGVTNFYVYGVGLLYEVTETATTTNIATYHFDARGSTVALTDTNGKVTDHVEYSAYGMTTYRLGTNDTPFLYNGRYGVQTDANGLLYMRARFYNPYLCRFVNADPSGFLGGLNWYAYANGNPVNDLDPFGLGAVEDSSSGSWLGDILKGIPLVGGVLSGAGNILSGVVDTAIGVLSFDQSSTLNLGLNQIVGGVANTGLGALDLAGKAWTSPNTAIGLIMGSANFVAGLVSGTNPQIDFKNNAVQFIGVPWGSGGALTVGNTQEYNNSDPSTIGPRYDGGPGGVVFGPHEEGHTYQYQALGPFFLPYYFMNGGISANNPLEISADNYSQTGRY